MKHYRLLVPVILALLVSSCASQKRAWYLQDANPFTPEQIAESGQIRIKPLDRSWSTAKTPNWQCRSTHRPR